MGLSELGGDDGHAGVELLPLGWAGESEFFDSVHLLDRLEFKRSFDKS